MTGLWTNICPTRTLDKLLICVKYPIKIYKNPIKMDDLRIKTLFKYTITQFVELGLHIGKYPLPFEWARAASCFGLLT